MANIQKKSFLGLLVLLCLAFQVNAYTNVTLPFYDDFNYAPSGVNNSQVGNFTEILTSNNGVSDDHYIVYNSTTGEGYVLGNTSADTNIDMRLYLNNSISSGILTVEYDISFKEYGYIYSPGGCDLGDSCYVQETIGFYNSSGISPVSFYDKAGFVYPTSSGGDFFSYSNKDNEYPELEYHYRLVYDLDNNTLKVYENQDYLGISSEGINHTVDYISFNFYRENQVGEVYLDNIQVYQSELSPLGEGDNGNLSDYRHYFTMPLYDDFSRDTTRTSFDINRYSNTSLWEEWGPYMDLTRDKQDVSYDGFKDIDVFLEQDGDSLDLWANQDGTLGTPWSYNSIALMLHNESISSGKVRVKLDFKENWNPDYEGQSRFYLYDYFDYAYTTTKVKEFYLRRVGGDTYIYEEGGANTKISGVIDNEWNNLVYDIDLDNNNVDVYINGVLRKADANYESSFSSILFEHLGSEYQSKQLNIDNLSISQGDIRILDNENKSAYSPFLISFEKDYDSLCSIYIDGTLDKILQVNDTLYNSNEEISINTNPGNHNVSINCSDGSKDSNIYSVTPKLSLSSYNENETMSFYVKLDTSNMNVTWDIYDKDNDILLTNGSLIGQGSGQITLINLTYDDFMYDNVIPTSREWVYNVYATNGSVEQNESLAFNITDNGNHSPNVFNMSSTTDSAYTNETIYFTCDALDVDGDNINFSVSMYINGVLKDTDENLYVKKYAESPYLTQKGNSQDYIGFDRRARQWDGSILPINNNTIQFTYMEDYYRVRVEYVRINWTDYSFSTLASNRLVSDYDLDRSFSAYTYGDNSVVMYTDDNGRRYSHALNWSNLNSVEVTDYFENYYGWGLEIKNSLVRVGTNRVIMVGVDIYWQGNSAILAIAQLLSNGIIRDYSAPRTQYSNRDNPFNLEVDSMGDKISTIHGDATNDKCIMNIFEYDNLSYNSPVKLHEVELIDARCEDTDVIQIDTSHTLVFYVNQDTDMGIAELYEFNDTNVERVSYIGYSSPLYSPEVLSYALEFNKQKIGDFVFYAYTDSNVDPNIRALTWDENYNLKFASNVITLTSLYADYINNLGYLKDDYLLHTIYRGDWSMINYDMQNRYSIADNDVPVYTVTPNQTTKYDNITVVCEVADTSGSDTFSYDLTIQNSPPSTPKGYDLRLIGIGDNLTPDAYGSEDIDNDTITYYYKYVLRDNTSVVLQDWTNSSFVMPDAYRDEWITIISKAVTEDAESGNYSEDFFIGKKVSLPFYDNFDREPDGTIVGNFTEILSLDDYVHDSFIDYNSSTGEGYVIGNVTANDWLDLSLYLDSPKTNGTLTLEYDMAFSDYGQPGRIGGGYYSSYMRGYSRLRNHTDGVGGQFWNIGGRVTEQYMTKSHSTPERYYHYRIIYDLDNATVSAYEDQNYLGVYEMDANFTTDRIEFFMYRDNIPGEVYLDNIQVYESKLSPSSIGDNGTLKDYRHYFEFPFFDNFDRDEDIDLRSVTRFDNESVWEEAGPYLYNGDGNVRTSIRQVTNESYLDIEHESRNCCYDTDSRVLMSMNESLSTGRIRVSSPLEFTTRDYTSYLIRFGDYNKDRYNPIKDYTDDYVKFEFVSYGHYLFLNNKKKSYTVDTFFDAIYNLSLEIDLDADLVYFYLDKSLIFSDSYTKNFSSVYFEDTSETINGDSSMKIYDLTITNGSVRFTDDYNASVTQVFNVSIYKDFASNCTITHNGVVQETVSIPDSYFNGVYPYELETFVIENNVTVNCSDGSSASNLYNLNDTAPTITQCEIVSGTYINDTFMAEMNATDAENNTMIYLYKFINADTNATLRDYNESASYTGCLNDTRCNYADDLKVMCKADTVILDTVNTSEIYDVENSDPTFTMEYPEGVIEADFDMNFSYFDYDNDSLLYSCYASYDKSYDKTVTLFTDATLDGTRTMDVDSWGNGYWYVWCNVTGHYFITDETLRISRPSSGSSSSGRVELETIEDYCGIQVVPSELTLTSENEVKLTVKNTKVSETYITRDIHFMGEVGDRLSIDKAELIIPPRETETLKVKPVGWEDIVGTASLYLVSPGCKDTVIPIDVNVSFEQSGVDTVSQNLITGWSVATQGENATLKRLNTYITEPVLPAYPMFKSYLIIGLIALFFGGLVISRSWADNELLDWTIKLVVWALLSGVISSMLILLIRSLWG